jgi:catechol 2,3-dioxygenase-like lactoylglutathione lyase family enzyme
MIKQLAHICINTEDLEITLHFYTQVLGLEKCFEFEKNGKMFGYYIKLGNNTFLEVFHGEPGKAGNISHVAIEVDDLDELIERIRSYDIKINDKVLGADNSWQVWITDPNGIKIEFHEYTKESLQLNGGKCII